jgi:hypothetical protein
MAIEESFHFQGGPTNADFDWTDEQEMRASGHPAAQADDYQDPGLTEAILLDTAEEAADR